MLEEKKTCLRKHIQAKRKALPQAQKIAYDKAIHRELKKHRLWEKSKKILLYASTPEEIHTHSLLTEKSYGKLFYLPRIQNKNLNLHQFTNFKDLEKHPFGILQPKAENPSIQLQAIELVIVPGIAFDLKGNRIGYGGGYYDRLLNQDKPPCIAPAYPFQILPSIFPEKTDIPVDWIITPQGSFQTKSSRAPIK